MKFDRTGIILYTIKYEECIDFYSNILELPVMFRTQELTCFEFGSAYLMVEVEDSFNGTDKNNTRNRTCLRMNVPDVKYLFEKLKANHIKADYHEYSWGTVTIFFDPDGNKCAFKDSEKFEKQVINGLQM